MMAWLGAIPESLQPSPPVVTKGTDLLTRQNETRHLTGWTEDRKVSAGRWQYPGMDRKGKLDPFLPFTQGSGKSCSRGFGEGCVRDSSARVQGWV